MVEYIIEYQTGNAVALTAHRRPRLAAALQSKI